MIEQQTLEGYIKYAEDLIAKIKSRQTIDPRFTAIQVTETSNPYDIYIQNSTPNNTTYRVSFIPTDGGTPYTQFEYLVGGSVTFYGFEILDDPVNWTDRVTMVITFKNPYGNADLFIKFRARSISSGTIQVVQI